MADNLTLALKIKADLNNALSNFKALENELQRTGNATNKLGAQSAIGAKGLESLGRQADSTTNKLGKTRAGVESISKQLASFRNQIYFFQSLAPVSFGIAGLASTADAYKNYEARVRLISHSNQEAQGTFKELMNIANQTGQQFASTAELYTRVYRSLGSAANSSEVLNFTKTVQQALVISGTGAQESQAALIQLSQGLAAGALRGEEFNSVAEQAPIILEVLQKSLGKTRGELRKMAEDGKLSTQLIIGAMKEASDEIQTQYDAMPRTISRSINELTNEWMKFVGQTDGAFSISSGIATGISFLAQNLNLFAGVLIAVTGIMSSRVLTSFLKATYSSARYNLSILQANATTVARAAIEVKAAQSALALARATDQETIATERLATANKHLALARASANAGGFARIGSAASAFLGGPLGVAITATLGLVAAYQYLKAKEEELEAQYNQTLSSIQSNIDKTEELIVSRKKLGEIGGFTDRLAQLDNNKKALDDAQKELELLKEKRAQLQDINQTNGFGLADTSKLEEYNKKIQELEELIKKLKGETQELGDITKTQFESAFEVAIKQSGELAEKLREIGDANAKEAMELLTPVIKDAEMQMKSVSAELDEINVKLGKELVNVTQTAKEQLLSLGDKFIAMARDAGVSGHALDKFNKKLEENLKLIDEIDHAKIAKDNEKFFADLSKRARQAKMTTKERLIDEINHREKATPEQIAQGIKDAEAIEAGEKYSRSRKNTNKSVSYKPKYDAETKNLELNIQYLRLTGQEVKANLTDIEGRYNKLLTEFQKASNVEGINLIKKVLPLEQAKVQIDGVQAEINRLFQNQSAQEQRIQSQVQTGLISHLEGQRQLKEVYAQTVAEIEKQLPLLEKLSQMPGAQGQQARAMLDQMKLKITELKTVGNDLEKAFKDGLTQGIQSSLLGLAQGTMTLKDAVKNLALTIVNSMAQIAAQQLAMQATSAIGGFIGAAGGAVAAATGGYITGPGTGTSDSIPARLSNGEYVIRAASVSRYGVDFLHAINRGQLRKYSTGGLVSMPKVASSKEPSLSQEMQNSGGMHAVASPVHIQQTLAVDSAELFTAGINTHAGEQAVLTLIRANKQTLKQELS